MDKFDLSEKEDDRLHDVAIYRNGRTLYECLVEMPLEELQAYPRKGYRWWMGRKAKSPQALALRDYVLHWRLIALDFREKYSREYLQSLSCEELWTFVNTHIQKTPQWAYEGPVRDVMKILFQQGKPFF